MEDAVSEIVSITMRAFENDDRQAALQVDPLEEVIDDLCDELKSRHIARVGRQECTLEQGFVFNDILTDFERISDHCTNVAVDILESAGNEFLSHEYHQSLEYRENDLFRKYFSEYKEKYAL